VVTVRTYWAWETTATLHLLGGAEAPTWGGEGRGISYRHARSLLVSSITRKTAELILLVVVTPVATTSVIISSSKIQNGDVLVPV